MYKIKTLTFVKKCCYLMIGIGWMPMACSAESKPQIIYGIEITSERHELLLTELL